MPAEGSILENSKDHADIISMCNYLLLLGMVGCIEYHHSTTQRDTVMHATFKSLCKEGEGEWNRGNQLKKVLG